MKIVVPSRGRPKYEQQITVNSLHNADLRHILIRTIGDTSLYPPHPDMIHVSASNYSQKCQWILHNFGVDSCDADDDGKILKLDDDLILLNVEDSGLTSPGDSSTWRRAVTLTECLLNDFALVSVAHRFMIHGRARPYEVNTRTQGWIGWNTNLLPIDRNRWPVYDRLSTLQDVDVQLQTFALGLESATITTICFRDHTPWGDGGCSVYRTETLGDDNARSLQALWPDFVELEETDTGLRYFQSRTEPTYRVHVPSDCIDEHGVPMDPWGIQMREEQKERLGNLKSIVRLKKAAKALIRR